MAVVVVPMHTFALADTFTCVPAAQVMSLHVATAVQQLATPASVPMAALALASSLYFPAPHLTEAALHLTSSQHVPCAHELAAPGHFMEVAEVLNFVPTAHLTLAHVATDVQHSATPPVLLLALSTPAFAES